MPVLRAESFSQTPSYTSCLPRSICLWVRQTSTVPSLVLRAVRQILQSVGYAEETVDTFIHRSVIEQLLSARHCVVLSEAVVTVADPQSISELSLMFPCIQVQHLDISRSGLLTQEGNGY